MSVRREPMTLFSEMTIALAHTKITDFLPGTSSGSSYSSKTMKTVTTFVIVLLSFICTDVSAENVMRVLFNNGLQNASLSCNASDWAKIDPIFTAVKPTRRNLRKVDVVSNDHMADFEMDVIGNDKVADEKKRKLLTNAQCRNLCAGQASGT